MSGPTVSCLHATRGRPEKALATMRLWAERATNPGDIEYVLAYEKGDAATEAHLDAVLPSANMPWFEGGVLAIRGDFGASCPAWNAAYQASSGKVLIQVSDDMLPPADYDTAILARLPTCWEVEPFVVAVADSNRKDRLLTTLVASRTFCEEEGCFLYPKYKSVWSDGDATFRAYKRKCVIEARDLVFEHKHPFFDKSVPMDSTYAMQNDTIRYYEGEKLFSERFPDWRATGIVDWA